MKDYIFTSESVTEGHPDKICDQIADAIVDAALAQDPYSNMAVECTIKDDFVLIYGECNTKAELDYETIALNEIKRIGYTEEYHVHTVVNQQSPEIHNAVNRDEVCAGDQGIMFGYACDENDEYMPLTIYYAHLLARQLTKVRREHPDLLKPDGKTQVSVEYENDEIKRIDTIVVSTQHSKDITQEEIKELIMNEVIKPCIDEKYLDENTKYFINPTGRFVIGGPHGDSGLTGRKIIVDTYGGTGRHGGGAFSGKDCTKVDRSAAYAARYVAKNIVAADLPLSICYEDEDILVVNKPADMPIHPSMNNYDNTLANAVCHYYQTQGIPYTFRCVNRLDRDTTGLTILAKHLISSAILNSEVSVRGISREYLAIVKGFTEDEGTVLSLIHI